MGDDGNSRVRQWQPPPRPEWVRRLNEEGRCLDIRSVVPLDAESLLAHARANTGLTDFGADDGWEDAFRVFVRGVDDEAELNLMGRLMTRSDILMHLEARLRIEDTYRRHPEIDAQELAAPYLIVGSGRSGTSAMQNLLALDPDNATPRHWEVLFPCPPPDASAPRDDARIALADARTTQWNRVTPEVVSIHEFGGELPTELIQLEALSFQSRGWLDLYGFSPSYNAYMATRSYVPAFSYAKRVLKLLQWKNPRARWILKSPAAMVTLPDAFAVFPDLRLVWMHRDPLKSLASAINMVGTLFRVRSDRALSEQAIRTITDPAGLAGMFSLVMDQMEQGLIPRERVHHVQYHDLMRDAVGTVAALYRDIGLELSGRARQAMETYLRENPRENRPPARYSVGDASSAERALFARYQSAFAVPSES